MLNDINRRLFLPANQNAATAGGGEGGELPVVNETLVKRLEGLSLSSQHTNDINYFNSLMDDIETMNYVRANDPASFTFAHALLLEEATQVWSRLRANNDSSLMQTPKRTIFGDASAGDSGAKKNMMKTPQQHSSSKKFFQWATLDTTKGAVNSPNWREEFKSNKKTVWTPSSKIKDNNNNRGLFKKNDQYTFKTKPGSSEEVVMNTSLLSLLEKKTSCKTIYELLKPSEEKAHIFKLEKKIFIPDHPGYNFIGRILGPRGISIRQLEAATKCGILIRGKGSVKDTSKEKSLSGKPGYEHLEEPLHVHITAMGTNMAQCQERLNEAVAIVESLLTPTYDEYKKTQLIHLAMINGTYRSPSSSGKEKKTVQQKGDGEEEKTVFEEHSD